MAVGVTVEPRRTVGAKSAAWKRRSERPSVVVPSGKKQTGAERVLHLDADGLEAGGAVAIDEDGAGESGGDSDDGVGADLFF
jgi:hypothetical protein